MESMEDDVVSLMFVMFVSDAYNKSYQIEATNWSHVWPCPWWRPFAPASFSPRLGRSSAEFGLRRCNRSSYTCTAEQKDQTNGPWRLGDIELKQELYIYIYICSSCTWQWSSDYILTISGHRINNGLQHYNKFGRIWKLVKAMAAWPHLKAGLK